MQREWKGIWIPKEIWLDSDLSITEKVLLMELDSLDNEHGCFADNEYFGDFLGVSVATVKRGLATLKKLGYIEEESFNGRTRVLRSLLIFGKAEKAGNPILKAVDKANEHPLVTWVKRELKKVASMSKPLTNEEAARLIERHGEELVRRKLESMNNNKNLNRRYESAYATCDNWCKMDGGGGDSGGGQTGMVF